LVEDQPVVRLGLRTLLAGSDIRLIDTAVSGEEGVRKSGGKEIDLVLLDVRLPDGDGLTTLARIKGTRPELPVLMFSAYENPAFVARAVALGAAGYVLKGVPKAELLDSIRRAAAGETHWTREELRRVTGALAAPRTSYDVDMPLTRREMDVLKHLVQGATNKRIADALEISYETVKEHVQNLLRKIGVVDRTQAAVWAIRTGMIE
jgi:DNA-binding NarL/FixJ family response regulator